MNDKPRVTRKFLESGMDFAAFWEMRAKGYVGELGNPYHDERQAAVVELLDAVPIRTAEQALDFGCGDGMVSVEVRRRGYQVTGIDIAPTMCELARRRLSANGLNAEIRQGGIERLDGLPAASLSLITCINVLAYLDAATVQTFYRHCRRLLVPGGALLLSHSNELFDLFTANSYTVRFFTSHFIDPARSEDLKSLFTRPDQPSTGSFATRANPLNFAPLMQEQGFREIRRSFCHYHPLPPALLDSEAFTPVPDLAPAERYKLMFQCSIFNSLLERLPDDERR